MTPDRIWGQRVWPMLLLAMTCAASTAAEPVLVVANDNRRPAGVLANEVLELEFRAARGQWAPEGADGPSVSVDAFGEVGASLMVPAPLIRVVEGTTIDAAITNELDAPLAVHGLCTRGGPTCDAITVPAGGTSRVRFASGTAGTYHYWATAIGAPVPFRELAGAFIVDRIDTPPSTDRVFVITEWSSLSPADLVAIVTADVPTEAFIARQPDLAFMVNGLSWPATERVAARVGVPERWRIVNLSSQPHPMHLHGFYFGVESRGDGRRDQLFGADARPNVVTEVVPPAGTMVMSWTPERAGNWLFHCHVMDHVSPTRRLSRPAVTQSSGPHEGEGDGHARHADGDPSLGMAGLVVGVSVTGADLERAADPPGPMRRLTLSIWGDSWHGEPATRTGVMLTEDGAAPTLPTSPGPPLVLTRGQPVEIAVENHLRESTAIHWHGIELESFYDGVHGWSGADQRRAPMIPPGGRFVVRFTPPRAGTFIYHTHLHDHRQLSSGLYGALVVVDPETRFDPATDHALVLGRAGLTSGRLRVPDATTPIVINGVSAPRLVWAAGTTHRLRVVNITADDALVVSLRDSRGLVSWRPLAKDGAALPRDRQIVGPASQALAVGETIDVEVEAPRGRGTFWIEVTTPAGAWQLQGRVIVR